ncbi:MAG: DMT family transporter [Rhodobacter sp.]|nr:DMT family transporter [Rhodobacter sp.]MCY4166786.1 DMT family transporter [Rhodobacter sp.]MCY4243260.1 DMT family transporter [Rhodobacter sp.]
MNCSFPHRPSFPYVGFISGTLFALIWSGSFIASKITLPLSPPLWLAAERLIGASLILLPFVGIHALRIWRDAEHSTRFRLLCSAALTQSFYLGAVFYALHSLPATFISVVGSSLPLVSIPVATAVLGERASWREVMVTISAVASVMIVILGRDGSPSIDTDASGFAVTLMLLAVLALATGNTLLKPVAETGQLLPLITIQMSVGGVLLAAVAAIVEGQPYFRPTPEVLVGLIYLIVIGSIGGMWLWILLLQQFSAIQASGFFLATPIFGIGLGYVLLGEVLTPVQLIGTGMLCLLITIRSGLGQSKPDKGQEISSPRQPPNQ